MSLLLRRARLLSTAAQLPPANGGGRNNLSRALIAAAVAAPIGFAAYKWQYDKDFQQTVKQAISSVGSPAVKPKENAVKQVTGKTTTVALPVAAPAPSEPTKEVKPQPSPSPSVESSSEKIDMAELDTIESILVPAHSETFKKAEVTDVEKRIETAQQEADEKHKKQSAESEATVHPKSSEPAPEKNQETPPETFQEAPDRQAIAAIRSSAQKVETQASESSKSELAKAEAQLRADIERVLAKDLGSLNEEGLRERVVQLTLELKDRNRWEAIRLHEVITKTIEDLSRKYLSIMKEQESAYENVVRAEVANAAMEAAATTEERLSRSLQDRLARQREALRMEMELNIEKAREEERQAADSERRARTAALHEMESKLLAFEEALREKDRARTELARTKRAILAALRFSRATLIEKASPEQVEQCLTELRLASAGDAIVAEALDALPHRVFASGVASVHKLAKSFETEVKPDVLRSALIPENASMVQQALARATTALMITGKPSVLPTPDDDSVDAKCVRIQASLDQEDLVSAVSQAQDLPKEILERSANLKDWLSQAQDRLRVDAAIRLLTARFEERE